MRVPVWQSCSPPMGFAPMPSRRCLLRDPLPVDVLVIVSFSSSILFPLFLGITSPFKRHYNFAKKAVSFPLFVPFSSFGYFLKCLYIYNLEIPKFDYVESSIETF